MAKSGRGTLTSEAESSAEPRELVRNPFEYGRELDADELVDRDAELRELAATVRNRGRVFLIGPRRFGKTSLLHVAGHQAEAAGAIVLRFDAEKYETLQLLAEAMLTSAARALEGTAERVVKAVAKAATRLRPRVTFDAEGGISVGLEAHYAEQLPVLTDALDAIEALAAGSKRAVVVILDEVQQIVVEHGAAAEKQLRATVQRHKHTSYVFAGSAVRLLTAMTSNANRPFYRMGARIFLGALPRPEFEAFLGAGFGQGGWSAGAEALGALLDVADDVPYNVQRLAHELWEMLRGAEIAALTEQTVVAGVERIVRMEDPAYTQIWTQLSLNQKKALKAVIEHRGESLQSAAVSGAYGLSTSSMQTSLAALESVHLIRTVSGAGRTTYRLVDPFLAVWLRLAQAV